LIINAEDQRILATCFGLGSQHDFGLFKQSDCAIAPETCILADSGYQGLAKIHPNSQTPAKKSKHHPLTPEQKAKNRILSKKRILIENVICKLKVFRILSERYRNRRKRFALRFNLISAILNFEIQYSA
jgi:hypothetical protein